MHRDSHSHFTLPSARRGGAALLLVMIAIGIATALGLGFLASQAMATGVAANSRNHTRARWIAESGVEITGGYIKANSDWRTAKTNGSWISNQSYGGGTLSVGVYDGQDSDGDGVIETDGSLSDDSTDPATIVSTGTYNGVTCTVRALISTVSQNTQTLLMIVPNAASLSAADAKRKTILESSGWTVNLLSESASQDDLDEALDEVLVVYVSSTVSSSSMAGKLDDLETGIVSEPLLYQDSLGGSNSDGSAVSASQITPINNSHYLTQGLTLNAPLTIATGSQSMCYMSGSLASGIQQLATRSSGGSNAMLAVLEVGATISGGEAASRRVFLPWGGSTFDPDSWNSTAIALLDRSLKWAASMDGAGTTSTNRIAVSDYVELRDSAKIDSFNSNTGATGGSDALVTTNSTKSNKISLEDSSAIKGRVEIGPGGSTGSVISIKNSATISGSQTVQNAIYPIPTANAPNSFPSSDGDATFSSGTTVLSADKHYSKLTVKSSAILQISGKISILCDKDVELKDSAQIQINSGSSLTLYCKKKLKIEGTSQFNVNTAKPSKVTVYLSGSKDVEVKNTARAYANIVCPRSKLKIVDSGHVYGTVLGKKIRIEDTGILSLDAISTTVVPVIGGATYSAAVSYLP